MKDVTDCWHSQQLQIFCLKICHETKSPNFQLKYVITSEIKDENIMSNAQILAEQKSELNSFNFPQKCCQSSNKLLVIIIETSAKKRKEGLQISVFKYAKFWDEPKKLIDRQTFSIRQLHFEKGCT